MNGHLRIDDLADGAPLDAAAEAHLASCADCRRALDQTRRLLASARTLGPIEPPTDLWPGIEAAVRPPARRRWMPLAAAGSALLAAACALVVCGGLAWLGSDGSAEQLAAADQALARGDLVAASGYLADARGPQAATRRSWLALIRGDTRTAEAELDGVADSPDREMRLALIALRKRDLEAVQRHAARSERPAGWVLAAEVSLADLDDAAAREWLMKASVDRGVSGDTARRYLALLDEQSLWATVTARWSLGLRDEAVEMAPDAVRDAEDANDLLVWAGRAAATKHGVEARELLEAGAPPPGQAWRWQATMAMVTLLEGRIDEGLRDFDALREAGAPREGLADARATAAAIVPDGAAVRALLEGVDTAAAARVRAERGLGGRWEDGSALGRWIGEAGD